MEKGVAGPAEFHLYKIVHADALCDLERAVQKR